MNAVTELESTPAVSSVAASLVASEAERVLRQSGYVALRRVQCEWQDGVIALGGKVPSFFMKQMAQTLVSQVVGVRRVDNRIKVQ
jgi:osmotically-inducible protein OsmY